MKLLLHIALATLVFLTPRLCMADEGLCCSRRMVFLPMEIPSVQERDPSAMIEGYVYSFLFHTDIFDCPIDITLFDYDGAKASAELMEKFAEIMNAKPDPDARRAIEQNMTFEYVWRATVTLDRLEEITPGAWEEGFAGEPNYIPSYAVGDWTLHLQLINIHFNEVVAEGNASWYGTASATRFGYSPDVYNRPRDSIHDLMRRVFSPVDDLIYEYERIPMRCTIVLPEEDIAAGDVVDIRLSDITDSKGRTSKPWQRVMVRVEQGEILNAPRCCPGEEKRYAFLVNDGSVSIRYAAPTKCGEEGELTETITVFNACDWGQEWVIPLKSTGCSTGGSKVISQRTFTIGCPRVLYLKYQRTGAGVGTSMGDTVELYIASDHLRMDQVLNADQQSSLVDLDSEQFLVIRRNKGNYVEYSLNIMGEALEKLNEKTDGFSSAWLEAFMKINYSVQDTGENGEINGYRCRKYITTLSMSIGTAVSEQWVTRDIDAGDLAFEEIQKYLLLAGMSQLDPINFGDMLLEARKIDGIMVFKRTETTTSFDEAGTPPRVSTQRLIETRLIEPKDGMFDVPEGFLRVEW